MNIPTVGASGAVFGLLIAFAMMFPDVELMLIFLPIPIKAKYLIPVYALLELFFGVANFKGDNIAHFAHLGGALFGFLLVRWWKRNQFRIN
jgi:membrane associated rhomboid family serine protease